MAPTLAFSHCRAFSGGFRSLGVVACGPGGRGFESRRSPSPRKVFVCRPFLEKSSDAGGREHPRRPCQTSSWAQNWPNLDFAYRLGEPRQRRGGGAEQLVHAGAIFLAPFAFEQLLVDPQGQRRVGMSHLLLDVGGVTAGREQQADVGAPQGVRGAVDKSPARPVRGGARWPRRPSSPAPAGRTLPADRRLP
jgi:hypothetical protein